MKTSRHVRPAVRTLNTDIARYEKTRAAEMAELGTVTLQRRHIADSFVSGKISSKQEETLIAGARKREVGITRRYAPTLAAEQHQGLLDLRRVRPLLSHLAIIRARVNLGLRNSDL